MKTFVAIVFICLIEAGLVVQAQTIYETFDTNPEVRGWVNESFGSTLFAYNNDGYVDACKIHRDSANIARYWKALDSAINDNQEFWLEVDLVLLDSSNSPLQTCQLGAFGNASSNSNSFVGARFAYDNYNGSPRGQRFDLYGYDSAGTATAPNNTALDQPDGLHYNVAARLKMHYYNDMGQKELSFSIYDIPEAKMSFMHANGAKILPATTTTILSSIGVGNRTDGVFWSTFQTLKFDNFYFSKEGPNLNPVPPSFGYFTFSGDFNKDRRVNLEDLVGYCPRRPSGLTGFVAVGTAVA